MQVVGYHRIATGRWLAVLGLVSLVSKEETAWANDATIKHSLTTRLSSVGIVPSLLIVAHIYHRYDDQTQQLLSKRT